MTWEPLYDQLLMQTDEPITPIELTLTKTRLLIRAECETAPSNWDLALRLKQIVTYPDVGIVVASKQSILLGVSTQIELAPSSEAYTLRLEVPFWMPSLRLKVWGEDLEASTPVGFLMAYTGNSEAVDLAAFGSRWLNLTSDEVRTIGKIGSNADLAEMWLEKIFIHLWEQYPTRTTLYDSVLNPVTRGATALEDWAALRRLSLPDFRGTAIVGAGNTRPSGIVIGADSATLAIANLPSHNHTGSGVVMGGSHSHAASSSDSSGGHSHTATINTGGSHAHTVTVNAAGDHNHMTSKNLDGLVAGGPHARLSTATPYDVPSNNAGSHQHAASAAFDAGHLHSSSVSTNGTHSHNLTITSQENHGHSLFIANQGSGQAISIMQSSAIEHLYISCGVAA